MDKETLHTKTSQKNPSNQVLGILQWFHIGDKDLVLNTLKDLKKLGINHLRTGISWADCYTKEGEQWFNWLLPTLAAEVTILPCFLYTPPSVGLQHKTSSPPRRPKMFADFIDVFVSKHGQHFEWVELWNEPNNRSEYDYILDPNWEFFIEMITGAAYWAKQLGKKVALGGMSPVDCNWLDEMAKSHVLDNVDAIGIHGFPETFDPHFIPWDEQLLQVQSVLKDHQIQSEIWITEAGYSTWKNDEIKQVHEFIKAIHSQANRVYWYSLYDLDPAKPTIDGFHVDEREYFFGMKKTGGQPKLLFNLLKDHSPLKLREVGFIKETMHLKKPSPTPEYVLITGGAGFVGVNLADHFLTLGQKVIIYDNLSREGVEKNLEWLMSQHDSSRIWVEIADTRNYYQLQKVMKHAKVVYHLAAQVAVTTSLTHPKHDFEVNIQGTFHLLEAIRNTSHQPPLIFTSTNKVYGNLEDLAFSETENSYVPKDSEILRKGISEDKQLDFHSPYGVSKGAADQYVLDYARSYGLMAVVFRMSCIYGPHQFGTEDQGWVAHFLIQILQGKPIHIYGNGKQVRDILYVEDLVSAFVLAWENIEKISGEAFNLGGGKERAISLLQLIHFIEEKYEVAVDLNFAETRTGDQVYYVSNTEKYQNATGWTPKVSIKKGLSQLTQWVNKHRVKNLSIHTKTNGILYEK
jgi:CDP-paratose 2-epimerase